MPKIITLSGNGKVGKKHPLSKIWPQQAVEPKRVEKMAQEVEVTSPKTKLGRGNRFRFMTKSK